MVAGDFNHDESALPQIALWKQHGWVEAQQLALALWQQQPQPTCKGATQRDLIFLSPEAAALTQRVRVKDVLVDLWTKAQQQQIRRWRQPAASFDPIHEQELPTEWYQHFAYSFENSLNGYVELDHNKDLPRRCRGRARWTEPEQVHTTAHAIKSSRPGEEIILSSLAGTAVRQWCKQLRRPQSYPHSLRSNVTSINSSLYCAQLWGAITGSSGFRGGFHHWWPNRQLQLQGSPCRLPHSPPPLPVAVLIFQDYRSSFRKFEAWHLHQ